VDAQRALCIRVMTDWFAARPLQARLAALVSALNLVTVAARVQEVVVPAALPATGETIARLVAPGGAAILEHVPDVLNVPGRGHHGF
jgi:hypothetical protein